MEVCLDGRRGEDREVPLVRENRVVGHDADAWVSEVQPARHLVISDEVDVPHPRSILLERAQTVPQLVAVAVSIVVGAIELRHGESSMAVAAGAAVVLSNGVRMNIP